MAVSMRSMLILVLVCLLFNNHNAILKQKFKSFIFQAKQISHTKRKKDKQNDKLISKI